MIRRPMPLKADPFSGDDVYMHVIIQRIDGWHVSNLNDSAHASDD